MHAGRNPVYVLLETGHGDRPEQPVKSIGQAGEDFALVATDGDGLPEFRVQAVHVQAQGRLLPPRLFPRASSALLVVASVSFMLEGEPR